LLSENLTALESWFAVYGVPVATVLATLLIVIGTPLIAAWAYFRRKEYETVRQRYLDDGLAKIIQQVEYGLSIFEYNWAHALQLLRIYRDLGPDSPVGFYESGYSSFDASLSFEASRHYLIIDLLGDKVCFNIHQLFMAFLHEADVLFRYDLSSTMRVSLEGTKDDKEIPAPRDIYDDYRKELWRIHKEGALYYAFLGHLQLIASELSKHHYTFRNLIIFRKESQVITSIISLKETFKKELTKYSEENASCL
jgi:hypothetical protein